ncbi:NADH-quinone oxidoreductase subunit A [Quadrisphaera granulorum]|uniref:NADH-quinone oxidoreductase subunit A n=1 Tax=Quadrisphaera granulorum TaxID=317664 RepID=UPI000D6BA06F|nr:NADH-quinone oxidoreductase subunit A [Quadrisphaera granulorum]TNM60449.1 NADH-quinone oxidoreductase subunit A [Streptomyces sp. NP160]
MAGYAGLAALLLTVIVGVAAAQLVSRSTAVDSKALLSLPFLSGSMPQEHALSRFHARWYPMTLVFLAFDVEMLFMYPWVEVVATVGLSAVVEMFIFLGVLLIAVVWAWREGAFRWV